MQKIALIIRPFGDQVELEPFRRVVLEWRERGHEVVPRLTFERSDAARFALAAKRAGFDRVIAAGGDGTVNEVVNGLTREPGRRPRLAVVPVGTANDFAADLEIPEEIEVAMRVAVEGRERTVDVANVNGRRFINVSTGGFGAEATEETSSEIKRRLGAWAYVITGVQKFVELKPVKARFDTDGGMVYRGRFLIFAVGNARRTGGGSRLTPKARFGDGKLDLLIVPEMPLMEFVGLLPELRAGTHADNPNIRYVQSSFVRVRARERLTISADGEPIHDRRFDYRLEDQPLRVMVP